MLASKTALGSRKQVAVFLLLIPLVASLLFLIPVETIPGNNIQFQATLFHLTDYFSLFVIATLESLLLVMWIYLLRHRKSQRNPKGFSGNESLGMLSGVPAFLFGTKLCPVCIAGIFGFLGPGAVYFAIQHRLWIFLISAAVLLVSIYSISRKINGTCEYCIE